MTPQETPATRRSVGISVVVCCHNSAPRLPATLAHLLRQEDPGVPWEVVLVDNASTDDTAAAAMRLWLGPSPAPLSVVPEPRLGLTNARLKGITASRYEFIIFVDDDNWLGPTYLRTANEVLVSNERVGASGGVSEGAFESTPPAWFDLAKSAYAIGDFGEVAHDPGEHGRWLCGAGLVLRRSAWQELTGLGFKPLLQDRAGKALTGGGDTELCMALVAAGWSQWYEPRLKLRHFMPRQRLDWKYRCRLARGIGMSSPRLYPYSPIYQRGGRSRPRVWLRRQWYFQYVRTLLHLMRHEPLRTILPQRFWREGDPRVAWVQEHLGRLSGLVACRRTFASNFDAYDRWTSRLLATGGNRIPLEAGSPRANDCETEPGRQGPGQPSTERDGPQHGPHDDYQA